MALRLILDKRERVIRSIGEPAGIVTLRRETTGFSWFISSHLEPVAPEPDKMTLILIGDEMGDDPDVEGRLFDSDEVIAAAADRRTCELLYVTAIGVAAAVWQMATESHHWERVGEMAEFLVNFRDSFASRWADTEPDK